nr:unnamed protein product [Callosobruchus chinensis]
MKEIRKINQVVATECAVSSPEYRDGQDDLKGMLGDFDSEPGYYKQVIKPMLTAGHENELVYWLKELGLIKNEFFCPKAQTGACMKMMSWTQARGNDMYQWKCSRCDEKRSIREDSIFLNVKCSFKNAIRILLAWSKGNDIDSMALMLGIKRQVVSMMYKKAGLVAQKYITYNTSEWSLGGPGKIVLVDSYPEMCLGSTEMREPKPILCIAEVKTFPQKYWFELLQPYRRTNQEHLQVVRKHILSSVKRIVAPGSVLIVPSNSILCSHADFMDLKYLYPLIIGTDDLGRHDNEHRTISGILDTIWREAVNICEEAQRYGHELISQYIIGRMWRQRYGNNAFEMLVYQLGL